MISSAADYDFVDWANGDMPTANVNGAIMPLRVGAAQNILKGEDVAFLAECVRDKVAAFSGLRFVSLDQSPGPATPDPVALTRKISSSQMLDIRSYLATQLARGIPSSGYGFLGEDVTISANPSYASSSNWNSLIAEGKQLFKAAYEGVWNPSTTAADFAVGAKVAKAPVLAMFDDAKDLARPIFISGTIGGPFIAESDMQCELISSAGSQTTDDTFIGYKTLWSSSSNYYVKRGTATLPVAITLPKTYFSGAKAWLLYHALNEYTFYSGGTYSLSRCGLLDLEQFATRLDSSNTFIWGFDRQNSIDLINHVMTTYSWTRRSPGPGGVVRQNIYPLWDCAIIIEGTPSGRTQWW